jgi:hypothetical protein
MNAAAAVAPRHGSAALQPRVSPIARSNADRLRALQKLQASRRVAMPVSRLGSNQAAAGGNTRVAAAGNALAAAGSNTLAATRGPHGVGPAGVPVLPQSHAAVRVAAASNQAARVLGVGGPRAAGPGLLGGATLGRNTNRAAVGGQLHQPKF